MRFSISELLSTREASSHPVMPQRMAGLVEKTARRTACDTSEKIEASFTGRIVGSGHNSLARNASEAARYRVVVVGHKVCRSTVQGSPQAAMYSMNDCILLRNAIRCQCIVEEAHRSANPDRRRLSSMPEHCCPIPRTSVAVGSFSFDSAQKT